MNTTIQLPSDTKSFDKILTLYILFFLGIIFVYRTNMIFSLAFFLGIFLFMHIKKDIYLFYGMILLLLDSPGNVFSETSLTRAYSMPHISLGPGLTLGILDFFWLTLILWGVSKKNVYHSFREEVKYYVVFGLFIFLYSLILGINTNYLIFLFRFMITYFALYRFFSRIQWDEQKLRIITNITIAIYILAFMSHISELYLQKSILTYLAGSKGGAIFAERSFVSEDNGGARIAASVYINLISVMLIVRRVTRGEVRIQDIAVLAMCYLSIILSATRGWTIAYTTMYVAILLATIFSKRLGYSSKVLAAIFVSILFVYAVNFITGNAIGRQLQYSFRRLDTLSLILEGDLEAGGTVGRLTYTSDDTLESWRANPILGWGFSKYSKPNGHVGNQNILQTYGILGFLLIFSIVLSFFLKNIRAWQIYGSREFWAYVITMIGILIIHSSSRQLLGYDPQFTQPIVFTLLIMLLVISGQGISRCAQTNG